MLICIYIYVFVSQVRILDVATGQVILVSHHPGKNPYEKLDPLGLPAVDDVVRQLLLNALDASGSAGDVHITVSDDEAKRVRIAVRDEGPGIPVQHAQRVFFPYYETEAERAGGGHGHAGARGGRRTGLRLRGGRASRTSGPADDAAHDGADGFPCSGFAHAHKGRSKHVQVSEQVFRERGEVFHERG